MSTFALFYDANLTQPVTTGTELTTEHNADGSTGNVDVHLYFGSADGTKKAQAASNPGTDQITLTVTDSNPGNGHAATVMKLAAAQGGLGAAGQSLNIGTQVLGGSANALSVWVRVNEGAQDVANWSDLGITSNQLKITAV